MHFFKGWNNNQIKMIQDCFSEKQFSINNVVYKDGDESSYLYLVKEGEFVLQKTLELEDEGKEAERKEIQSMINNIQMQNKKRYLLKNQETHLSAIEKQLKNINTQESPTEILFEDQIRMKKLKKKELKKIKIITQGETFGAEEFLAILLDPEQRQQFQANLIQKRQLIASCSSVTGVLYLIHIKDILNKIAKNEELLPMLLKSLKQKKQSSENQVNLIKKQKQLAPKEVNVAKNLVFDSDEEQEMKEQNKNILRNYNFQEFKIEKHLVYPDVNQKFKLQENKQVPLQSPKSEKILLLSPTSKQKKRNEQYKVSDIVARIAKQVDNSNQEYNQLHDTRQPFQRLNNKKSKTQIISSQSSQETPIKSTQPAQNNNNRDEQYPTVKHLLFESSSHYKLPKSKYSLYNLDSNLSIPLMQTIDDDRNNQDLTTKGIQTNLNHEQNIFEQANQTKSLTNLQTHNLDKFPIRNFRKSHNQIEYKFEQQSLTSPKVSDPQQSLNTLTISTQTFQKNKNTLKNSKINFFKINQMKEQLLSKTNSFNTNNSPTSISSQFILKTGSNEYLGSGNDSPRTMPARSIISPKSVGSFEQFTIDRSKFFKQSKLKEISQTKVDNSPRVTNKPSRLSQNYQQSSLSQFQQINSYSLFRSDQSAIELSPLDSKLASITNIKPDPNQQNQCHILLPQDKSEKQQLHKHHQTLPIQFKTHRKTSQPNLLTKSSFLPLKYYAEQLSTSQTKFNFMPKNLKNHQKEAIYNEFKRFSLSINTQKIKTQV